MRTFDSTITLAYSQLNAFPTNEQRDNHHRCSDFSFLCLGHLALGEGETNLTLYLLIFPKILASRSHHATREGCGDCRRCQDGIDIGS